MTKLRKALFIGMSLLFATAVLGVTAQASSTTSASIGTHPQQMDSPTPSPAPT